jgi:hypothetical protein
MFPYVILIGLVALCMGILNVLGHFAAPAAAPVLLNLAMIGSVACVSRFSDSQTVRVMGLAVGVLAGRGASIGPAAALIWSSTAFGSGNVPAVAPANEEPSACSCCPLFSARRSIRSISWWGPCWPPCFPKAAFPTFTMPTDWFNFRWAYFCPGGGNGRAAQPFAAGGRWRPCRHGRHLQSCHEPGAVS